MIKQDQTDGFVYMEGVQRSQVDCSDCGKIFISKVNHDLDGNHKVVCPYCGHEHWRAIKAGVVTAQRWGSQHGPNRDVPTERMWSDKTVGVETNTAAEFIRQRWLDKG